MINIHERAYPGFTEADLGELLDTLGQPDDRLWPTAMRNFPAMRLDGPLTALPAGGHGLVRYHTVAYEKGKSVTWEFEQEMGLPGTHTASVHPDVGDGPILRHTIDAGVTGATRLLWPLAIRWLHDACIEELLDQAEASLTGVPAQPRKHGLWTRFLLKVAPSPAKEEERLALQAN